MVGTYKRQENHATILDHFVYETFDSIITCGVFSIFCQIKWNQINIGFINENKKKEIMEKLKQKPMIEQ